ncbi:hypothetical protein HMN09_01248500 [Mycena chlorophos]|uniref:Pet127-domain-containing protein n=1 Tax=Mycena chlorophos TaxID=658473 RepID=A0A8H6S284_MYCCL|nr:hypothetical protein HMN09_01248500 [Mycena chlorophos]
MRRAGVHLSRRLSTSLARDTTRPRLSDRLKASSQPLIAQSKLALLHTHEESVRVLNALAATSTPAVEEPVTWSDEPIHTTGDWGPDTLVPNADLAPNEESPGATSKRKTRKKRAEAEKAATPKPATKKKTVKAKAAKAKPSEEIIDEAPPISEPNLTPTSTSVRSTEGLIEQTSERVLQGASYVQPISEQRPVATLAHGLERVLFNPGVHWLQDPRSRVYNFSPYLKNIPKVQDFAFEKLVGFVKSSRDEDLRNLAKREGRMFAGSTSSLSGMLSHCYFLISEHREVDISSLSEAFQREDKTFTPGQRMPTSVIFNYKDGTYAIDSDSDDTTKNILTWLVGNSVRKVLDHAGRRIQRVSALFFTGILVRSNQRKTLFAKLTDIPSRRSSSCGRNWTVWILGCPVPGCSTLKLEHACQSGWIFSTGRLVDLSWVRNVAEVAQENSGYTLRSAQGFYESFEREYYDLIRSAFLKYGFQVRIGNMDGVIVAYHNTARTFGFQYIPLEEMDRCLFGTEPTAGERIFQKCVALLEVISTEIVKCFPEQSVKCTFECEQDERELNVWVQPVTASEDEALMAPIHQLVVRAQSFLSDTPVAANRAINSAPNRPWTLHWSLSHISDNPHLIRASYNAAMGRKFRAWSIPTGISEEQLPDWWRGINYGPPQAVEAATDPETGAPLTAANDKFDPTRFRTADMRVQILRDLARSGHQFTNMMEQFDSQRPVVVLGQPYDPAALKGEQLSLNLEALGHSEDTHKDASGDTRYGRQDALRLLRQLSGQRKRRLPT